jgi:hypothetical protein
MVPQTNTAAASTSLQLYHPEANQPATDSEEAVTYDMYSGQYSLSIGGKKLRSVEDRTRTFNPRKRQWRGREGDFNVFRVEGWEYGNEETQEGVIPINTPTPEFRPSYDGVQAANLIGAALGDNKLNRFPPVRREPLTIGECDRVYFESYGDGGHSFGVIQGGNTQPLEKRSA